MVYFNGMLIAKLPTILSFVDHTKYQKINFTMKSLVGKNNISSTMVGPPKKLTGTTITGRGFLVKEVSIRQ